MPAAPPASATQVHWAFDRDYLYVAIAAPLTSGASPSAVVERREYDADLSRVDHVHLLLDTDRDYCTAIELAVAADGRTYDRCCGEAEYNPKWHVSVRNDSSHWYAELAIELSELTCTAELADTAWAVSARRWQPTQARRAGRGCAATPPICTAAACCCSNETRLFPIDCEPQRRWLKSK